MELLEQKIAETLKKWRGAGLLYVAYALLAEGLFLGYLAFAALFTAETLLPTFVTARLSLAKFFAVLVTLSFVLAFLGRFLDLSFPFTVNKKNPFLWIGLLWATAVVAISLIKFPLWSIPLFLLGFAASGYLFWKIFLEEENS